MAKILFRRAEKALKTRTDELNRSDSTLKENVGVYIPTDEDKVDLTTLCARAKTGDVPSACALAELAFQAHDVPLLRAVHRLGMPEVFDADHVHIWAAFAYGDVACLVWYARTHRISKRMLLDPRCDLDYSSGTPTNDALLTILHAYGKVPADALMDMCVHQKWPGWVSTVDILGASLHPRHLHQMPAPVHKQDLIDFLDKGLYTALKKEGTAHDWTTLATLLYKTT